MDIGLYTNDNWKIIILNIITNNFLNKLFIWICMKTVVISLGGSLIFPDSIDVVFLKKFKEIIEKYILENRVVLVCGGGKLARIYQQAFHDLVGDDHEAKDWLGIGATHQNAQLVKAMFEGKAYEKVLDDPHVDIETDKHIIIAAGWKPGHSTDMDAMLLAEKLGADRVINMSNVDFVYDKNPKEFADAKKLPKMTWDEFFEIVGEEWSPGLNAPFDPVASKHAQKTGIKVCILSADLDNLVACMNGEEWVGTEITN